MNLNIRTNEDWVDFISCKYYHNISIEGSNSFRHLLLPITVLIPVILVATGLTRTSILIAAGGVVVAWLAG